MKGGYCMLKDFAAPEIPEGIDLSERIAEEQEKLFKNQMAIKEANLPVMVMFEGWGAAGPVSSGSRICRRSRTTTAAIPSSTAT